MTDRAYNLRMVTLRYDRIDELIGDEKSGRVKSIAALAEISPSYLWELRKGKVPNVSAVVLGRVADALGVSVDYLLGIDQDERGMPVPSADYAQYVARINELAGSLREAMVRIIADAFGLIDQAEDQSEQRNQERRLLDSIPIERQELVLRALEAVAEGQLDFDERGNLVLASAAGGSDDPISSGQVR